MHEGCQFAFSVKTSFFLKKPANHRDNKKHFERISFLFLMLTAPFRHVYSEALISMSNIKDSPLKHMQLEEVPITSPSNLLSDNP